MGVPLEMLGGKHPAREEGALSKHPPAQGLMVSLAQLDEVTFKNSQERDLLENKIEQ